MIKQSSILVFVLFSFISITVNGQSIWSKSNINQFRNASAEETMILPEHFLAYTLSVDALKDQLANAPKEEAKKNGVDGILVELPMPDGSFETFEVYDSPVFAPKLAAKYPTIKSYKGVSTKNSATNVRFNTGPYGFHAAIHGINEIIYIDPYTKISTTEYITYNVKDHMSQLDIPGPLCGVLDEHKPAKQEFTAKKRSANPIDLSVYRLAIACTGEWGAIRGTVEKALADMNTGVNRINQIYENELAMRLVLIDDNDLLLNFDSTTDPYLQVGSGGAMLSVNTGILNLRVGVGAYDLGHVYHTSCDVGGIASLSSMCNAQSKGNGVTCHYSSNLNFMAASVTSHEFGHQMSAQHTFNNCNGNESASNAFEPGSGSTIMSYGGLCGGSLNVVNNGQGDDYYHVASLIQIYDHTRGDGLAGDNCAMKIETSNIEPTATIVHEDGFYIPENTYFYLEGIGEDENAEDQLTYTWEQMNRGPSSPLGEPVGDAPHFRSMPPNPSPIRYFPSADNILLGNFDRTEVSFRGDRTVDFMFTVRDNNAEAGTAVWEPIQFYVRETEEKFEITSQNGSENYKVGEEVEVTWEVAGTNEAPFNTEFVDILLFTGNSNTFDIKNMTVLAKEVFNNGAAKVIMPNEITTQGRIIVRASESIYFAINETNIGIEEDESAAMIINAEPLAQIECLPTSFTYNLESENLQNVEGSITYTILDGLPEGAEVTFDPAVTEVGASTTMTINPANDFMGGNYEVRIGAITEDLDTFSRTIYLYLRSPDHSTITAISPETNASGIGISPEFSWEGSVNAETYTFEISESPVFGSTNIITTTGLTELTYKPVIFLEKNTVYYWRVVANNYCGEDTNAKIYAFSTESLFCTEIAPAEGVLPINISGSGSPTIQAPLEVDITGNIADINVKQWFGQHGNNKDMRVSLIAPDGKEVVLVSGKCEQQNFNCGFDDASDENVKCPLNSGKVYKPQQLLEAFNGDPLEGTWQLQIDDMKSGNGGRLEGLLVEFCSNQALNTPYIVRNEKMQIGWNSTSIVSAGRLKVDDDNNSSEELIYTLVEVPAQGELTFDGMPFSTGDQFSQQEIDEDKLVYTSAAANYETYFSFTVVDGEGGFIGITNFEIEVDELTSLEEIELQDEISIYPNPARDILTVDLSGSDLQYSSINIINIEGQTVIQQNLNGNDKTNLDVSVLTPGFYIINVRSEDKIVAKKVIIN